jgi:outer membrane protein OmpA-like peptidoglycan-associated protein
MKKTMIAVALSTFIISGCATNASNTQKGAGIGAVIGALVGKGTGDNDKSRYIWGAALGALAGSAVGNYMDKQEVVFREELANSGVEVYREGDSIRLSIPGNITFPSGKAAIVTSFYPILEDVAKVLNRYEKTKLSVEGHTDSVGDANYNRQLSIQRANSVANYLQGTGVSANRLQTLGMGESQPISGNDNVQGRQENRRVELRIIPLQG